MIHLHINEVWEGGIIRETCKHVCGHDFSSAQDREEHHLNNYFLISGVVDQYSIIRTYKQTIMLIQ